MFYHVVTLGCQMNKSDSERIASVLEAMGYRRADDEAQADLIGVVACSVRQKAIDRVYSMIHKWNARKQSRALITFVTGCVLDDDQAKFLKLFDLSFPIAELPRLPARLRQYGMVTPYAVQLDQTDRSATGEMASDGDADIPIDGSADSTPTAITRFWSIRPRYDSPYEAYVPIQNGCNNFCSYCAVPYTRGREVSRPSSAIMREIRQLVESGCRSITLLGQNVNAYGLDAGDQEPAFPQLLASIGQYGETSGHDFRVYFTSPHPRDMTPAVIETIRRYRCLARQIHLPVQSGDDTVLRRMNRNHTVEAYRRIVADIRRLLPDVTLFTDIMVGFPGETEAQFMRTAALMEDIRFNMAYIACYSPRPGAASAQWPDDVPHQEKKARLRRLSLLLQRHAGEYNANLIGKRLPILVTGQAPRINGFLAGMTEGRIAARFPSGDNTLIGSFVDLDVKSATAFAIEGVVADARRERSCA